MNRQFTIREAEASDLSKLLQLYEHLHADDAGLPDRAKLESIWNEILQNPMLHCIISELGDTIVSSCILVIVPNLTRAARPYALIENVVTHSDYRDQGHATAVLTQDHCRIRTVLQDNAHVQQSKR